MSISSSPLPGIARTARAFLFRAAIMALSGTVAIAQAQERPRSTETVEAVYDAAVVYQPAPGQFGITELMDAAMSGDASQVAALIAQGADLDARDFSGATALIRAAGVGAEEIAATLLDAGADPDISMDDGRSPLGVAVQYKQRSIALLLLQHAADPDTQLNPGKPRLRKSVLELAAVTGQAEVVAALIASGSDLSGPGPAALNAALWQSHEGIAATLIAAGVDVNALSFDPEEVRHSQVGERALQTASQKGLLSTVQLLLDHGADINAVNRQGWSALHFALRENQPDVIELLLASGATTSADDLATAFSAGNPALSRMLVDKLDLMALPIEQLDNLIALADANNDTQMLDILFGAREAHVPPSPPQFLYAAAAASDCKLVLWEPRRDVRRTVLEKKGPCATDIFVNNEAQALYILSNAYITIHSLRSTASPGRSVGLPVDMIDANLSRLKQQFRRAYAGNTADTMDWVTASVVQIGKLESGELAFVTHTVGPADGTYGFVYAFVDGSWQEIGHEACHRFDACYFERVKGHAINARPSRFAIWHPDLRRNPYFIEKSEVAEVHAEDISWNGAVAFEIDGRRSVLRYDRGESGHCVDDCVYTIGMELQLPGRDPIVLADYSGNNAVVDRYALVRTGSQEYSELIDLGTGESVFGPLQLAGWLQ
ncbi:MAG: ankyrin repeat domain-containing protein [Gammaproteobacteria bacterium]|nr:ankyrin repeat domain-containing protein [Gammaproteobacteria bacterium]